MATDANGNIVFGNYSVGINHVGSYQVSGWPYLTGTLIAAGVEHKISFPKVTKSVTVIFSGSAGVDYGAGIDGMRIHFASTSSGDVIAGHRYVSLDADDDEAITFNAKCSDIYISAYGAGQKGYEVVAELTNIPTSSNTLITGSGITDPGEDPRAGI